MPYGLRSPPFFSCVRSRWSPPPFRPRLQKWKINVYSALVRTAEKFPPLPCESLYLRYLSSSGEKCCREKGGLFAASTQKFVVGAALGKGMEGQWTESKSERWGRQGSWLVAIVCVPPFLRFGMCDECPGTTSLCGLLFCRFRSPISSLILSCSSLPPTPLCLWRPCRARYALYAHTAPGLVRREGEE